MGKAIYSILYVTAISIGAVGTLRIVISIFDSAFALMAFPTMIATILLSPRVVRATRIYFKKYDLSRNGTASK